MFKCIVRSKSWKPEDYELFYHDSDAWDEIKKSNEIPMDEEVGVEWVPIEASPGALTNLRSMEREDWRIYVSNSWNDYDYQIPVPDWFCGEIAYGIVWEKLKTLLEQGRYQETIHSSLKLGRLETLPTGLKEIKGDLNLTNNEVVTEINSGLVVEGRVVLASNVDYSNLEFIKAANGILKENPNREYRSCMSSCGTMAWPVYSGKMIQIAKEPSYLKYINGEWSKKMVTSWIHAEYENEHKPEEIVGHGVLNTETGKVERDE